MARTSSPAAATRATEPMSAVLSSGSARSCARSIPIASPSTTTPGLATATTGPADQIAAARPLVTELHEPAIDLGAVARSGVGASDPCRAGFGEQKRKHPDKR